MTGIHDGWVMRGEKLGNGVGGVGTQCACGRVLNDCNRAGTQGSGGRAGEWDWGAKGVRGIVHAGGAALPDGDDVIT